MKRLFWLFGILGVISLTLSLLPVFGWLEAKNSEKTQADFFDFSGSSYVFFGNYSLQGSIFFFISIGIGLCFLAIAYRIKWKEAEASENSPAKLYKSNFSFYHKLATVILKLQFRPMLFCNIILSKIIPNQNWFDAIDDTLILGALPMKSVRKKLAVNKVINMCEEWPGPIGEYQANGIEQLWIPVLDTTSPSLKQINLAVQFIQQAKESRQTVYLHCKAGSGRSATIAIAWLVHSTSLSLEDAQKHLQSIRPHVSKKLYERQSLIDFSKELRT